MACSNHGIYTVDSIYIYVYMRHVIYSIYIYAALCSHIWGPTPTPTHVHGFDLGVKRKPFIHRRCVTVVLGFKKRLATTVEISADESLGPMKSYSYVPFDSRFWMSWTANLYPKISKSSSTKDGFPQQKMLPHIAKTVLPVWPGYRQRCTLMVFFVWYLSIDSLAGMVVFLSCWVKNISYVPNTIDLFHLNSNA